MKFTYDELSKLSEKLFKYVMFEIHKKFYRVELDKLNISFYDVNERLIDKMELNK